MKKLNTRDAMPESPASATKMKSRSNPEETLAAVRLPSVIVGRIAAIAESGTPLVDFPGNTSRKLVTARSLVPIAAKDAGRKIALTFEDGDPGLPIVAGLLQTSADVPAQTRELKLDDENLVLSARKQVVIECGKSSITLTSAGKVLIRGAYLLSRSSGVNRIKGGSVQIN